MVRGELSKCHPNGGIPRQDKPSLRPPTMDTQCLAPAWKSGQLSQSLAPQPPQMGNQVLRRHTHQGTAVTTCRGALPERRRRQANAMSKHWHCCRACPEPLETSQAVLLLLRDMTRGTPPGRTPGLSLGTHSLLPAPRHRSADQYAFLLPTSWPPTRMPRMRGAVSLSMEHPTHGHQAWPRMHRLRQKPSLQKVVTCPPWEQRGHA